jgi:hypothetical protein
VRLKEFEKELRKLGKLLGGDPEVLVLSGRPQEFDEAVVESQMVTKSNNVWRIHTREQEYKESNPITLAIIVG